VKKSNKVLTDVEFTSYAALGKAIARPEGKVLFVKGVVPGDVADILVTKEKKDYAEGRVLQIKKFSGERVLPFCQHFGVCGGCTWQMLPYPKQLEYKEQEVRNTFKKSGIAAEVLPIIGSDKDREYRNKLEFSFSNKEYVVRAESPEGNINPKNAVGYHVAGVFDKVLDIHNCHLMENINNEIRNSLRNFALEKKYEFYDIRNHTGWLRNMIVRYSTLGECLVNIVVAHKDINAQNEIKDFLIQKVQGITTLLFTINPKFNSTIYDLEPEVFYGPGFIYEQLGKMKFMISPKSFFQTNTRQAEKLYQVTRDFAFLKGNEIVYDLYCGTGSIGLFISENTKKIIGVELIDDAVKDAKKNAEINDVKNAEFFTGDVIKICNDSFFEKHGHPDTVIVDPPRSGLHPKLVSKLLEIGAPQIVYVSCNIATQTRDLNLLADKYTIKKLQPVDMFPQTYHIECVALLELSN